MLKNTKKNLKLIHAFDLIHTNLLSKTLERESDSVGSLLCEVLSQIAVLVSKCNTCVRLV